MKKPKRQSLSHYNKPSWKKPIKPVKVAEEPEKVEVVEEKPSVNTVMAFTKSLSLMNFALPYGSDRRWGLGWAQFAETMEDRAQKMRAELGPLPRYQLMVKFAKSEVTRVQSKHIEELRHLDALREQDKDYRRKLQQRIIEQDQSISNLLMQLSQLKVEKHQAYVQAITAIRVEGRLMREA